MEFLFTVADVFEITGRGCVLTPGLPTDPDSPNIGNGTKILLETPTGEIISTKIRAIEWINFRKKPEKITVPILLPKEIKKGDIPVGTKVLLLEENFKTIKEANAEQVSTHKPLD